MASSAESPLGSALEANVEALPNCGQDTRIGLPSASCALTSDCY